MPKKFEFDLRSDTVTKPCEKMLKAMMKAQVGDDLFGEDPSVNLLQNTVAKDLGFNHGLFVPSGTMANQIAISISTVPGDAILCEEQSHIILYESGATSAVNGVQYDTISDLTEDKVFAGAYRKESEVTAPTRLFIYENTHNEKGGIARSVSHTNKALELARAAGLQCHLDGARVWNAAEASGCSPKELAEGFDSASACFSKGLGAPAGSLLLLKSEIQLQRARRMRKRLGGSMRQAGYLASAALFAYENNVQRLAEDHAFRDELASFLTDEGCELKQNGPATSMLYFRHPDRDSQSLQRSLEEQSIGCFALSEGYLRFVFHRDVDIKKSDELKRRVKLSLTA